ncbi:hypothetical protein OA90_16420 [Labrenzia sp. OB1]|nr:hypothetical protein OA90_16420 [Labrenzia sp. OB1]
MAAKGREGLCSGIVVSGHVTTSKTDFTGWSTLVVDSTKTPARRTKLLNLKVEPCCSSYKAWNTGTVVALELKDGIFWWSVCCSTCRQQNGDDFFGFNVEPFSRQTLLVKFPMQLCFERSIFCGFNVTK